MIYITLLVYIKPGQEETYNQFEAKAIPIIGKYNGELLLRIKPTEQTYVEGTIENPYEVHIISFPTDDDFKRFAQDEERKNFVHLKDQSIEKIILIKGNK